MVFLEPSSDMAGFNAPLSQIVILDSQKRIFLKIFDDVVDIFRGITKRFHGLTDFTGAKTILQSLLDRIKKDNILCLWFPGTAGGTTENTRCFDGGNKHALVLGTLFADRIVLVLKSQRFHESRY
jgi:hypothetical protein